MKTIVLTLTVTMDETDNIRRDAEDLKYAIQHRLFGEGVFEDDALVDIWSCTTIIKP